MRLTAGVRRRWLSGLLGLLAIAGCGGGQAAPAPGRHQAARPRHADHRLVLTATSPAPARGPLIRGAEARRAAVPVLMYHVIKAPPPGTPYPELWVAPERFSAEMAALRSEGYQGVTLLQVLNAWHAGTALPRHPVVVSFDDGYPSQSRSAAPVLRRLGWPGVLNLEVHNLGPEGIGVHAVRALLAAGWEVDSHTVTHPDLTTVGDARLQSELVTSRRLLRRRFGPGVATLFCYPSGRYDARVEAAVRAAGYRAATTTQPGWATPAADRFALPRVRVDGSDDAAAVLAAVRAAGP
jgi:peptidoglycan/xylan/chitin deacetylase (PgdA/CDA1 family)